MPSHVIQKAKLRLLVPPFAGFCFYGAWAFYVNMDHGYFMGIKAAITQGGYSFAVTLLLSVLVERLFVRFQSVSLGDYWVGFIAIALLALVSWAVNALAGTPEILWTILPGLTVSAIYTSVYIITLRKLAHKAVDV